MSADSTAEVAVEQAPEETPEAVTDGGDATQAEEKMEESTAAPSEETTEGTTEAATEGSSEAKKETGMSGTVAKHYNDLREGTLFDRARSRIYYQRNFNNWIKSMIIANSLKAVDRKKGCTVLDLCCGKGGDLLKWTKGNLKKLVCADIAAVSVQQCQKRYRDMADRNRRTGNAKTFAAEFIAADCAEVLLSERYHDKDIVFDLCSCQFSFHYSFETAARARTMLRNACERLRPGGYFVGTIPNGYELVSRLKASEDLSFGNDVYKVTFENKDSFPLYGCKYDFHLEGVVDCPEFLIYFPLLEEMAKEFDMELVYLKKFQEVYEDNCGPTDNQALMSKMQALEQYPPEKGTPPASKKDEDYSHAETRHTEVMGMENEEKKPTSIGTLSKSEWEASSLYCAFAFKKAGDFEEEEEEEEAPAEEEKKEEEEKTEEVANGNGDEAAEAEGEGGEEGGAEAEAEAEAEEGGGEEEAQ
ncbi:mRNA cap guanine-N7 methyltransferase-like isoform X1 [Lytechinus pictus]|uniref:mRNA cap guanine-N7 methyltransferase-like isoform X1 n=1 Tax=Lytechinus pictus TaxID=7653 RepID=UPI0030B9DCEE